MRLWKFVAAKQNTNLQFYTSDPKVFKRVLILLEAYHVAKVFNVR